MNIEDIRKGFWQVIILLLSVAVVGWGVLFFVDEPLWEKVTDRINVFSHRANEKTKEARKNAKEVGKDLKESIK